MTRPRLTALCVSMMLAACGGAAQRRAVVPYPGIVHAPGQYPDDFLARQHIDTQHDGRDVGFDAVLQKRGDTLVLIGLTPYGSRAFVLEQRGTGITFTSSMPGELPFPPSYILLDVHRALLAGLPRPAGTALADGSHEGVVDGERVSERWTAAHLVERRFERVDQRPAGAIVVRYGGEGLTADGKPTGVITLTNGWLGYVLRVTTSEHRSLPSAPRSR
jgi:hypothetical protein